MISPDRYEHLQYSQPESTLNCIDNTPLVFTMRYGDAIRSKFKFSFIIIGLFFLWGLFFISDPGWLSLGVTLFLILLAYYKFRIDRVVEIREEGIHESALLRRWAWKWEEIRQINREMIPGLERGNQSRALERITFVHESGREIAIDSHMKSYAAAWKVVWRKSRNHKIPVDTREISFFLLYYW